MSVQHLEFSLLTYHFNQELRKFPRITLPIYSNSIEICTAEFNTENLLFQLWHTSDQSYIGIRSSYPKEKHKMILRFEDGRVIPIRVEINVSDFADCCEQPFFTVLANLISSHLTKVLEELALYDNSFVGRLVERNKFATVDKYYGDLKYLYEQFGMTTIYNEEGCFLATNILSKYLLDKFQVDTVLPKRTGDTLLRIAALLGNTYGHFLVFRFIYGNTSLFWILSNEFVEYRVYDKESTYYNEYFLMTQLTK